ncbi:MAG TPA: 30S ribosomal protein S3 [Methanomicrobia archaeon]|nr:30S ribosomal protein S3 [Methanomicrobia archaeon]
MDEYFRTELDRAGYGGMELKRTPLGTQITVKVEKPGMIIGKDGRRIKRITSDIVKRQELDNPQIDVQPIDVPELNAQLMANRLAKLIERGWHFRRAGRSTLQRIMDRGARGCEIRMTGKLKGPRGRMEKMVDGYIKHCGSLAEEIVDNGYAIAKKKAGVIGVKVRIVRPDAYVPDALRMELTAVAGKVEAGTPEVAEAAGVPAASKEPAAAEQEQEPTVTPNAETEPQSEAKKEKKRARAAGKKAATAAAPAEEVPPEVTEPAGADETGPEA